MQILNKQLHCMYYTEQELTSLDVAKVKLISD